jgi:hypothetical protein
MPILYEPGFRAGFALERPVLSRDSDYGQNVWHLADHDGYHYCRPGGEVRF